MAFPVMLGDLEPSQGQDDNSPHGLYYRPVLSKLENSAFLLTAVAALPTREQADERHAQKGSVRTQIIEAEIRRPEQLLADHREDEFRNHYEVTRKMEDHRQQNALISYLQVPEPEVEMWREILQAVGYWCEDHLSTALLAAVRCTGPK